MVAAMEQSVERRFPKPPARGRPGVSVRVLLASYEAFQLDTEISPAQRERLERQWQQAIERHQRIEAQWQRLTQGKRWPHRHLLSVYDDAIAPMIKSKRNCPTPFVRKPGL
jgi:hypothetical protein